MKLLEQFHSDLVLLNNTRPDCFEITVQIHKAMYVSWVEIIYNTQRPLFEGKYLNVNRVKWTFTRWNDGYFPLPSLFADDLAYFWSFRYVIMPKESHQRWGITAETYMRFSAICTLCSNRSNVAIIQTLFAFINAQQ